ncbi:MAG: hypothetical protein ACRC03_13860, partial [Romboutsia sp.]
EKEIYAVPGSIKSRYSEGCNRLIREGIKTYLSPKDIIENNELKITKTIDERENIILSLLNKNGTTIDFIKLKTGLKECSLEQLLFEMEVDGSVKQVGGLFFPS